MSLSLSSLTLNNEHRAAFNITRLPFYAVVHPTEGFLESGRCGPSRLREFGQKLDEWESGSCSVDYVVDEEGVHTRRLIKA